MDVMLCHKYMVINCIFVIMTQTYIFYKCASNTLYTSAQKNGMLHKCVSVHEHIR